MSEEEILIKIKDSIVKGEEEQAIDYTKEAIKLAIDVKTILNKGIIEATQIVGKFFENGEYFLPDLLISADAMVGVMDILRPKLLSDVTQKTNATIIIGSVEGDVHSIGKSLMCSLLEGQGFHVIDLGTDVPPARFIEEAKKVLPAIIGLSGLLTLSINKMRETVYLLREEGVTSKIIVGGGILTKEAVALIGADDYATDGWEGLKKIKQLLERGR
ncbi:MAG TPA: cobalamin-dependent protein [Candidatus Deferrimicrobium sp.]|nr:cobalamin-dependent protein [Candidatus Deferrimicrobium sp.]